VTEALQTIAREQEMAPRAPRRLRVWVDMTNSPHVVIFRPLIARMIAHGHEVTVTARDFAQTLGLLERYEIPHTVIGAHGGAGRVGKARAMGFRTTALTRFARRERFDVAVAHGSTDQPPAAYLAGTPQVTMFDYEFAAVMHHWNGRLATRVLVPSAIPEWALWRYGIRAPKLVRYPGLKEEYYLADHVLDREVIPELGLDPSRIIAVLRPPPEVTLYHRGLSSDVFSATLDRLLDAAPEVQTVVLPRTAEQRAQLVGSTAIVPERPVDGPSLVAIADFVVSAGGTMNREAAALGVPAYSPFAGRLGAVDMALIADGRLRRLEEPTAVAVEKRDRRVPGTRRDPEVLVDLILAVAGGPH
jgi:predicted glycosyltransferase